MNPSDNEILDRLDALIQETTAIRDLIANRKKTELVSKPKIRPKIQPKTVELIGYFDGASRGNPGPAGLGAVIKDASGQILETRADYIGDKATNNVAEYNGLIAVLELAKKHHGTDVTIYGDSELVIKQINDKYQVKKEHLKDLHKQAKGLIANFPKIEIVHVKRDQNQEADQLSNEAIDNK